jgi:hypothetical protein
MKARLPNMRVQRPRVVLPALARCSPPTHRPLGRVFAVAAVALATIRCSDSEWSGVNISAMEDWHGASVVIDGRQVGKLEHLMLHDSAWEEWLKKQHGDSPMFHMVALNVPFEASKVGPAVHRVVIQKLGRGSVEGEFTYPDPRGSSVQFLMVNGDKLENQPGPDAYGSHP